MTGHVPRVRRDSPFATSAVVPAGARAELYLHPGQLVVAREPSAIKTILGSCVAVCLWDEAARIGGMNHFLLPFGSAQSDAPDRFGNLAVPRLIAALCALGATPASMRAKVFGGSAMIRGAASGAARIGEQNARAALDLLQSAGIALAASDLGGQRGRKIVFHSDDGNVALWEL